MSVGNTLGYSSLRASEGKSQEQSLSQEWEQVGRESQVMEGGQEGEDEVEDKGRESKSSLAVRMLLRMGP